MGDAGLKSSAELSLPVASAPADRVLIDSVTDALGNYGIRVHGGFSDSPGGGDSLALLNYRVSTIDPTSGISGALLAGNPAAYAVLCGCLLGLGWDA